MLMPKQYRAELFRTHRLRDCPIEVARVDNAEIVQYLFASDFQITASKYGVSFAGTSVNYHDPTEVMTVIRWATRIARELAAGRGIMPQTEVTWTIRLRTKGTTAWYTKHKKDLVIERITIERAITDLRSIWIKFYESQYPRG